jgi:hypothetical protein
MERPNQTTLGLLFIAIAANACSNSAPTVSTGSGGESVGSGGVTASGGATSSGGSTGSGGALATGGSGTGGENSTGTGGVGTGGASATGGDGAGAAAGSSATGGSATGGSGTGGSATGGAGGQAVSSGGTGGSGTAGAGGDLLTIVGSFDGALLLYPCGNASSDGYDCPNVMCTANAATHVTPPYTIGGQSGSTYTMTMHVYGVVEPYAYVGGTRDAGNASVTTNLDLFLRGGAAQPLGATGSDYNTYEMDVSKPGGGTPDVYFLNAVDPSENPHGSNSTNTSHLTFPVSYDAKNIKVYGGGSIVIKTYDSNCTQVMNCGTKAQNTGNVCNQHYTVPAVTMAMPPAPSSFMQPYISGNGQQFAQWLYIDVTAVTP